jgi:hypothetical protein
MKCLLRNVRRRAGLDLGFRISEHEQGLRRCAQ